MSSVSAQSSLGQAPPGLCHGPGDAREPLSHSAHIREDEAEAIRTLPTVALCYLLILFALLDCV